MCGGNALKKFVYNFYKKRSCSCGETQIPTASFWGAPVFECAFEILTFTLM